MKRKQFNTYNFLNDYVIIKFPNNSEQTIIDIEDYNKIKDYAWYLKRGQWGTYISGYVNKKVVILHRFIMNAQRGQFIDHIDKDTLNNKKINLRFCSNQENGFNRKISKNNSSGFIGVMWRKDKNKWEARIKVNYKLIHLGLFNNIEDAIIKRLESEKKYCGKFAPQQHLFEQYGI